MKIGIFCGAVGLGGSQNTTASLSVEMARRGHQVTLYVDKLRFRSFENWQYLDVVDLPVNLLCPNALGCLSFPNLLRCFMNVVRKNLDVILCISSGPLPLVMLCSLLRNIPCVLYVVGPYMNRTIRVFGGISVANSEETRDMLAEWLRRPLEEIPIIRARINTNHFDTTVRYQPCNDVVRVLLVSRLETSKTAGVIKVVNAFRMLCEQGKSVVLDVYGDGQDFAEIKHCVDEINQYLGIDVIRMHGATSKVIDYIPESDIVIGLGRSAWEAMACSKPTVVVGKEGLGGVVCEEELPHLMYHNFTARGCGRETGPDEIAQALIPLIESPQKRRELGEFALHVVREYYDIAIGVRQFLMVLDRARQEESHYRRSMPLAIVKILSLWIERYCKSFLFWFLRPHAVLSAIRKSVRLQKEYQIKSGCNNTFA